MGAARARADRTPSLGQADDRPPRLNHLRGQAAGQELARAGHYRGSRTPDRGRAGSLGAPGTLEPQGDA